MSSPLQPSLLGKVVRWDPDKGYGFIETAGKQVFIHWRDFTPAALRAQYWGCH